MSRDVSCPGLLSLAAQAIPGHPACLPGKPGGLDGLSSGPGGLHGSLGKVSAGLFFQARPRQTSMWSSLPQAEAAAGLARPILTLPGRLRLSISFHLHLGAPELVYYEVFCVVCHIVSCLLFSPAYFRPRFRHRHYCRILDSQGANGLLLYVYMSEHHIPFDTS